MGWTAKESLKFLLDQGIYLFSTLALGIKCPEFQADYMSF
jgi:hypothetical protein